MISLKLVVPLGCLVAFSSALPWSDRGEQPQRSDDYRPDSYCDSFNRDSRYSRPDLFQHCVCSTANRGGREYAYTYYGDKYGVSRDDIASALKRCQPLDRNRGPVGDSATSFDASRSSFQDFTIDNTISLKKVSAITAFANAPAENVKKLGDWSYSKAEAPSYDGPYPGFPTSLSGASDSPDESTTPSQESTSSQRPATAGLEENSEPNSSSATESPQGFDDNDSMNSDDTLASDSLGDNLDKSDDAVDRRVTNADDLTDMNGVGGRNGGDDNEKSARAGDEDSAGKHEGTDETSSGRDTVPDTPSNSSQEKSDKQLVKNKQFSRGLASGEFLGEIIPRGLFYDFDGVNGAKETPVSIISRGLFYFDGINGAREAPTPVEELTAVRRDEDKDNTVEWPSFRPVPDHNNHVGLKEDEGEE